MSVAGVAVAALLYATSGAAKPVEGVLCLQSDCRMVEGRHHRVASAPVARQFTWAQKDGTEIVAGILAANGEIVDLDRDTIPLSLSLEGSSPDQWPSTCEITASDERRAMSLTVTIPAKSAASLRKLRVPLNVTRIEFRAPHHREAHKTIERESRVLGRVILNAYPVIQGSVRTADDDPLSGAVITLPSERTLTRTDASGRFRAEVTDEWPAFLKIGAPGRTTKLVTLPPVEANLTLSPLTLGVGGSAHIHVENVAEGTEVELLRHVENGFEPRPIARAETGADATVRFDDLDSGDYTAVVRGSGPLQIQTATLRVKEAKTTEQTITVEPVILRTFVQHNDEPVPNAAITLMQGRGEWRATYSVDATGRSETELWQQGEFGAFIKIPDRPTPLVIHATLSGTKEIEWKIDAPNRRITGTVAAEDRQLIAGSEVSLKVESADSGAQMRTTTDDRGHFEFSYVPAGRHTLTATASGHVDARVEFDLTEADEGRAVAFVLNRARDVRVVVHSSSGIPLTSATIMDERPGRMPWTTDANGTAVIPFDRDETKTLYVLPREGSFAIVELRAPSKETSDPVTITVPPAAATIIVQSRSASGAAIPNVHLAMRYNGRLIPPAVREVMFVRQGHPYGADSAGDARFRNLPIGLYEFWPYFTPGEEQRIALGLASPPPVRLGAQPGDNTVVLTFTPEERRGTR